MVVFAASPCGTTAANRDLTGTWVDAPNRGDLFVFVQSGNTVTLTSPLTQQLFNETIDYTFVSFDGKVLTMDASYAFNDGSGSSGSGVATFTLSADGNSLVVASSGTDNRGVPYRNGGTITRTTGTVALVPSAITLNGAPGGNKVTDNTSLTLYNCGGGTSNFTVVTKSPWLLAGPTGGNKTLAAGGSVNITLTADPSNLTVSGSPYSDTVTIGAVNSGDFGPTVASVQFVIKSNKDTLTVGTVGPGSGTNLETNTSLHFSANLTYSLNSAQNAVLYVELDDAFGSLLAVSPNVPITQGGPFQKTVGVDFTIPDGTSGVSLSAKIQPPGNAGPLVVPVASYLAFPHAKIFAAAAPNLWSGTLPALGVVFNFTKGAPDRTSVNVTVQTDSGAPIGTIPPVDVSGDSGLYTIALNNVTIPKETSRLLVTATQAGNPPFEEMISSTYAIAVDDPPVLSGFQIQSNFQFFPASQPSSLFSADGNLVKVVAQISFPPLRHDATASVILDGSGAIESLPEGAGESGELFSASFSRKNPGPYTFHIELKNDAGQTVRSESSAPGTADFLAITDAATYFPSLGGISFPVSAAWTGMAKIDVNGLAFNGPIGDQGTRKDSLSHVDCVSFQIQATPGTFQCNLFGIANDIEVVDYFAQIVYTNGTNGPTGGGQITTARSFTPKPATPAQTGPATITVSANTGPTSFTNVTSNLGGLISGITPALASASFAPDRAPLRAAATAAQPSSLVFLQGGLQYDPPVPDDGVFTTKVVYRYSAASFPDDPGFNESNLVLVSYDPATHKLLTYPSVVDTGAKTVTATSGGLAPYYALAIPASTLIPLSNLPLDPLKPAASTAIALFNAGTAPVNTTLTARGADATALSASPASSSLIPGQQASATFGNLGAQPSGIQGWIQAGADAPGAAAVAILGELTSLESLSLGPASTFLVLPGVEIKAGIYTEIDVANTTPFDATAVLLELHDSTGALKDQLQFQLAAKASFTSQLDQLFPKESPAFQGYILARANQRISVAAIERADNAMSALAAQPVNSSSATSLYAPLFQAGRGMAARLDIVNPNTSDAHVTIQFNKDDGTLFAKAINTTIAAGAQYWIDVGSTLALDATKSSTASISVASDLAGLAGDVTFGDTTSPANHRTSIPLSPAQTALAVPYVLNTTALPTTLYAMNAGPAKATVIVSYRTPDGGITGKGSLSIPPNGRGIQPLATLIAASAGQTGGALQINSDQPLATVAMIVPLNPVSDFAAEPAVLSFLGPASGPTPAITPGGVTNAAAAKTTLARGSLGTIYGTNFTTGNATYQPGSLPFPLNLGGVFVTVGGIPAPLYFVNSGQINFQVPFEVTGSSANVVVTVNGNSSSSVSVGLADYAVGIFGYARTASALDPIIVHLDNSLVSPSSPAIPGETLLIYATGIGKLTNAPRSGAAAPGGPLATAVDTPIVTVGGAKTNVLFAGLTPGGVGLAQLDVTLPQSLPSGSLPVVIQFPGDSSPPLNLAVKGNLAGSPQLSVSASSLPFGNVTVGQSSTLSANLNNSGTAALTLGNVSVSGTGFSLVPLPAAVFIAPGGTQAVMVKFAPASAGPASGTLSISSNGGNASVSLSGTGVSAGAPAISVAVTTLDFGRVTTGQTKDQTFTINNNGNAPLTVTSLTAGAPFSVVSPSTPINIAAGSSTVVTLRFAPSAAQSYSATLTIASNDPSTPSLAVSLTGTGAAATPLACGFTLGPDIYAKWTSLGGQSSVVGCPTANETEAPKSPQGTTGRTATFTNGLIYWHRDGPFAGQAYEVHSCLAAYAGIKSSAGAFGFPVSDRFSVDGGSRNDFQGGYILTGIIPGQCYTFAAGDDYTGVWSTDRGLGTFVQDSFNVNGTYGTMGGTISGSLAGTELSLSWQDSANLGQATFTLSADGQSFAGNYTKQGSPASSQWNGIRAAGGTSGWFTPSRLNFGNVPVNTSKTLNIYVTEPGGTPLNIVQYTSDNPAFQATVGGFSILPGGSGVITFKFTPSAAGAVSSNITITTLDPARPMVTIPVTGVGQ
jgi:uncharacterized protein (TIGR03437 family)